MSEDGYFEKNIFVHERDNEENLLSVDVDLEIKGEKGKVKVIPMTKGQIDEMRNEAMSNKALMKANPEEAKKKQIQQDKDLILNHIVSPKFSEKDFDYFKPKEYLELVKGVMVASGFEKEEVEAMFKTIVADAVKELGEDKVPQE